MKVLLEKGKLKQSTQPADYSFISSKDFFSWPSNLIPAISGVSGGRVLIGSKASLQALPLVHREAPLVRSTDSQKNESFVSKLGKNFFSIKALRPGTVVKVTNNEIQVKTASGEVDSYEIYRNFHLGRSSSFEHYVKVKPGDTVKKDQILATSNYTDNKGNLALGVNLRTAVMPYRSGNFEDAFVLTESGAKKLEAEQVIRHRIEKRKGIQVNKSKYISLFPNRFVNAQLNTIDDDGVVKKGTIVNFNDPIFLAISPKTLKSTELHLGQFSKALKHAFNDNSQVWELQSPGEVIEVSKADDLITVLIKTKRPVAIGDKLSNPFGAKGVVSSIIPDTQAPCDEKGRPVDILLNTMSINSRVAPAIAVALGLGKIAEKKNKPLKVSHFIDGSAIEKTIAELKKNKLSDVEPLYDPISGKTLNVLTGPLYYTRLVHIAEDKESGRGQGGSYTIDLQPARGTEESSKKIGNLGTTALLSHGVTNVLREFTTIKSTLNDEFWRRLKTGASVPSPQVPFIFNKFIANLQGAGIKVDKKGTVFQILPMTDKDVEKLSAGSIKSPLTYRIKKGNLIPEPNGLFDPQKTGVAGERFNHIDLNFPVPNPISEDYLKKLLGVTRKEYLDLIVSGQLESKLKAINVDAKIEEYKQIVKSGHRHKRDDALKLLAFLTTLKNNGMHPSDLILHKIPVIPAQFRPILVQEDKLLATDINNLYKDLIMNNNSLKNISNIPENVATMLKKTQYDAVKAVMGLGEPITIKNKEKQIKGLLASTLGIRGGSPKTSMFQAKVVNKPLELMGRAVLTPDAKLDLDEAYVSQNILWKAYAPFVIRRMVMKGIPATHAHEYLEKRHPLAKAALMEELQYRPAIVSRDPMLHKFNLLGFYLKPNPDPKDTTIKLNPLVFKGFGADNDGDQLNINVPATEEAVQDIKEKMMPSKNIFSIKDPTVTTIVPSNEAAYGLYTLSTASSNKPPKKYKTEEDVLKDFYAGKLDIDDNVEIG